ncbi:ATP-dependent DNA helicase [Lentilactobacillus sp. SPB1-3]|uniref:ATP-dependent DNA helicase n=1 Tax=Lentilactobacillus terminaliae TaxID=3003483 RepID=A0ACD5DF58_9LACO|nr:ATP-dependent DNA helicase [Lentilactobacillus sp. SPB1-3]MCZ0976540.1 ATP-dependent DNA helicase [Lentilactobacillus sp. SPB1-3]
MNSIQIGIRTLIEFILKRGDLVPTSSSDNSMAAGSRIHRKIQKSRPVTYESEVSLKTDFEYLGTNFEVSGRADGINRLSNEVLIEEIKTSDVIFSELNDNTLDLYWAQAKVYGYILMTSENLKHVTLQLTYVQTPDEKITASKIDYSIAEATEFFNNLITEYKKWLKLRHDLDKSRIASAKSLQFPFPDYRPGQYDISKVVYKTIVNKKHLFLEAPTGTGKTISTLFPAIKSMGEKLINRIFYLTAKQSTRKVCEEAIDLLTSKGLTVKSITLTARDQIIFPEEQDIPADQNPYMIGYYDRIKPAILDIINNEDQITKHVIQKYANKHQVDPFEFSLDVSLFCDVIICDYNYLFDPQVHLQRFFSVPDDTNCFLVDEAHNLVSRAREMYSATLSMSPIAQIIEHLKSDAEANDNLIKKFQSLKRAFMRYSKESREQNQDNYSQVEPLINFNSKVSKLIDTIHDWLAKQQPSDTVDEVVAYYLSCRTYNLISQYYDDTYRTRIILVDDDVLFRQFCIDPAQQIAESLSLGRAAILFSATLSPLTYYRRVLGDESDSIQYAAGSSFPRENFNLIIHNGINTTYNQRLNNIPNICEGLSAMIAGKPGHYMAFFPSMTFMNQVAEAFIAANPDVTVKIQSSNMDHDQRTAFLDHFRTVDHQTTLGFAVLGGIFSEGIDLKHEQLIGVAIIGVGLPMINEESDLVKEYYDSDHHRGFMYAYQLPGFNNVTQAAGRLIRTQTDEGIIVLMDQRFSQNRYRQIFPNHWSQPKIVNDTDQLKNTIQNFWANK